MRNNPDVLSQSLAEPSRRALLEHLRFGSKTVTQLVEATQLKQPNVSNHLAKMRQQGIVRAERLGRQVHYSLSTPLAEVMLRMLEYAANPVVEGAAEFYGNSSAHNSLVYPGAEHNGALGQTAEVSAYDAGSASLPIPVRPAPDIYTDTSLGQEALGEWREAYFQAMIAGNEDRAVTLVNALLAQRLPMETIYSSVFVWGVNHIGELYQQGKTDEAHEHMASAITERMMARVSQFYTPVARTSYRAILGCVAGNWHVLGIRMLGDALRSLGWGTVYLGANVPTSSFVSMVQSMRPALVIVSCAMEEQNAEAHILVTRLDALRHKHGNEQDFKKHNNEHNNNHNAEKESAQFQLVVGGHWFHEHPEELVHLPVDFTASDLREFMEAVYTRYPIARN
jgi:MerR family transcriptional regulator, light-induced transcriptional regulator